MSQEKLQAFVEVVSKSEELQKRFNLIQMEAVKSTAEKLAKLSESAGTPFTAEEYLKSVAESLEEMSTEQLRSVAGGEFSLSADEGLKFMNSIIGSFGGSQCVVTLIHSLAEKGNPLECIPVRK